LAVIVLLMLIGAAAEHSMGRKLWGISGTPGFWSGDINSSHNSQFLLDPYTLTHITHGILFCILLAVAFKRRSETTRLTIAVALETAWEILENTDMVIQRYRTETISLNYYGDSIVNSMGDIVMCILGFMIASRLPRRAAIAVVIVFEVVLLLLVRDNLALNILMLIRPSRMIRMWQTGV
jgi:hypothetical protein